jgi:membrane protein implicated in regulation of membrane protease activity
MTLESFYLVCFLVGFLLSMVSFVAQAADLHLGDGHGDAGDLQGVDASVDAPGGEHASHHFKAGVVSKFNFSTITAFLAWFGGTGYLLLRYTAIWWLFAVVLAKLVGLAGAALVFFFLKKLAERDRTLNPADFDMIGVLGEVSCQVYAGGVGEMIFTQDGVRKAASIRAEDGGPIGKGEEVVITRYEKGIGYVRRWSDLAGMSAGQ